MGELLKQEHNLAVLQIVLDRAASTDTGKIVFDLEIKRQRVMEPLHISCQEMNVPLRLREFRKYRYVEPDFMIPDWVVQKLNEELAGYMDEGVPLWIQLTNTSGFLPVVPWERLLQSRLHLPILRLPYYTLKPFTDAGSLDVVICSSSPEAKDEIPIVHLVKQITDELFASVNRPMIRAHVFADGDSYAGLQEALKDRLTTADGNGVILYDPKKAPDFDPGTHQTSDTGARSTTDSPWLAWIAESLAGRSVDALHFICHGYLSSDQGALAFAQSPTRNEDRSIARFVGAQQLAAFSTQLGAWLIGFTSPPLNFSLLGLRLLADQIARLRPGPVLIQQDRPDIVPGLHGETYGFLCNPDADTPPASDGLLLYCHPWKIKQVADEADEGIQADWLNQYTLAKAEIIEVLQTDQNTPNWVAASQRYLENCTAEILNESQDWHAASATRQGEEEALRILSDVLTRHAVSKIKES